MCSVLQRRSVNSCHYYLVQYSCKWLKITVRKFHPISDSEETVTPYLVFLLIFQSRLLSTVTVPENRLLQAKFLRRLLLILVLQRLYLCTKLSTTWLHRVRCRPNKHTKLKDTWLTHVIVNLINLKKNHKSIFICSLIIPEKRQQVRSAPSDQQHQHHDHPQQDPTCPPASWKIMQPKINKIWANKILKINLYRICEQPHYMKIMDAAKHSQIEIRVLY